MRRIVGSAIPRKAASALSEYLSPRLRRSHLKMKTNSCGSNRPAGSWVFFPLPRCASLSTGLPFRTWNLTRFPRKLPQMRATSPRGRRCVFGPHMTPLVASPVSPGSVWTDTWFSAISSSPASIVDGRRRWRRYWRGVRASEGGNEAVDERGTVAVEGRLDILAGYRGRVMTVAAGPTREPAAHGRAIPAGLRSRATARRPR